LKPFAYAYSELILFRKSFYQIDKKIKNMFEIFFLIHVSGVTRLGLSPITVPPPSKSWLRRYLTRLSI
jgi:hypothetical protein